LLSIKAIVMLTAESKTNGYAHEGRAPGSGCALRDVITRRGQCLTNEPMAMRSARPMIANGTIQVHQGRTERKVICESKDSDDISPMLFKRRQTQRSYLRTTRSPFGDGSSNYVDDFRRRSVIVVPAFGWSTRHDARTRRPTLLCALRHEVRELLVERRPSMFLLEPRQPVVTAAARQARPAINRPTEHAAPRTYNHPHLVAQVPAERGESARHGMDGRL